jgi:hypothetical protein
MKDFDQLVEMLNEQPGKKPVVFTFGRFNPPSMGHEKLIEKVKNTAKSIGAEHRIYPSHSHDLKKNPLKHSQKVDFMKKMFPGTNIVSDKNALTPFHVLKELEKKGYKHIVLVVGGDRVDDLKKQIEKMMDHSDPAKKLNIDRFEVVSAGERDPDASDVSGMSASKLRKLASEGDFKTFKSGLSSQTTKYDAQRLFFAVRKGMGLSEQVNNNDEVQQIDELTRQQRLKMSRIARRTARRRLMARKRKSRRLKSSPEMWAKARKVARARIRKRFIKNRVWSEMSFGEKEMVDARLAKVSKKRLDRLAKKLLPKVRQAERDRLKRLRAKSSGRPINTTKSGILPVTASNESYVRDYKKEYERYHGTPEQIQRRAARVMARRKLIRAGKVSIGDGYDIDHIDGDPLNNEESNLRVVDRHFNRSRDNNKWRAKKTEPKSFETFVGSLKGTKNKSE